MQRFTFLAAAAALLFLSSADEPTPNAPAASATPATTETVRAADGRVIVIGFDGADARTIRGLMESDPASYPTFAKLASEGTFEPLEVVAPPESPVSWAALNTGQNPAKTGVPGFLKRDTTTMFPTFGHIIADDKKPIEEFDNTPLPLWSKGTMGAICGGACFVIAFLLGLLVSGGRIAIGMVVGLIGGGAGAYVGMQARDMLPTEISVTSNPNEARNFWDLTAENGVNTIILDAAQSFSMPTPSGAKVLSGLGVPDARGALGDWFVYTTNPEEREREGRKTTTAGMVFRVDDRGGEIDTLIYGPKNFWELEQLEKELAEIAVKFKDPGLPMAESGKLATREAELKPLIKNGKSASKLDLRTTVDMSIKLGANDAQVTIGGQTQTVALGEWSEFYELRFELNRLLKVDAITRVRVVKTDPYFELFVNVLDIDPRNPPFWQPISSPPEFAAELAADCGLYETYGWPTLTMPVKDREVDPELLMEDVEFTMQWREKLTHSVLARDDWRVMMSVFSTTDRVQHMMYRYWDETHPQYVAADSDRAMTFFGETMKLRDAIPTIYKHMDRVIGDVLDSLEPNDTLMVVSDHGFQSFHRQVNVNNWLIEQGYLVMKPGVSKKKGNDSFLLFVDWDKTRVYSMGMGFLYVNQIGRERNGIVPASDADALMAEVREKLLVATDQDGGAPICRSVYVTKEIHNGPFLDRESDMIIGFAPTYRVSWSSTSGGVALDRDDNLLPICTDNTSPWSGGHISVNLPDVAGVFFCNKKVDVPAEGVRALQIAPTVLDLVGVPKSDDMDLGPLSIR